MTTAPAAAIGDNHRADGGELEHGDLHAESYAHVHGGPAVLDIGGDIGAMVVTMSAAAEGTELHLRSTHEPPIRVHTGVWRRGFGERFSTTAVFAELVEGNYWVLDSNNACLRQVEIRGGTLTTVDLRD